MFLFENTKASKLSLKDIMATESRLSYKRTKTPSSTSEIDKKFTIRIIL